MSVHDHVEFDESAAEPGTVNRLFNRGCLSIPAMSPCRGQGPFRGLSLMIVCGVGASTYRAKYEEFVFRRLTEVTDTTVPAGTRTGSA